LTRVQLAQPLSNKVAGSKSRSSSEASTAATLTSLTTVLATVLAIVTSVVAAVVASIVAALAAVLAIVTSIVTSIVTTVVTAVVAAVVGNLEPDTVVLGATLSDGHKYRLVVTSGCHAADTVETLGETRREISAQETLTVAGVSNNLTVLEGLRGGVVGFVGVGEGSGLQVADLNGELNGAVGLDNVVVLRASKDGRNHLTGGRDFSHGCEKLDDDEL
jgi:hypothetical protein